MFWARVVMNEGMNLNSLPAESSVFLKQEPLVINIPKNAITVEVIILMK